MASYADIIRGLEIFRDAGGQSFGGAEHDIIFGPTETEVVLTEDQKGELDTLGWFISEEYDGWCHFV